MRMKALKTFYGDEGSLKKGIEFEAKDGNVSAYERRGLAVRVGKGQPSGERLTNKAAEAGPLGSRGGRIGADNAQSSSPTDQAPKTRRSKKSEDTPESSASTKDGGSHRGQTSSMPAMDRIGESEKA